MSSNPRLAAAMTPATIFRSIRDEKPTLFIDEAEDRGGEAADTMRSVLNVGYRRGATIPRVGKNGVEHWPAYCPKVFILIGDVNPTLRDRSIVMRMQRGEPKTRFVFDHAQAEGNELGVRAKATVDESKPKLLDTYTQHKGLTFLMDRDEEIWLPLFAICEVLAPKRIAELQRIAVDLSTEKTQEARGMSDGTAERNAEDDEYSKRLVRDLWTVLNGDRFVLTEQALRALHAIPTAPWRKFRGDDGLTSIAMAAMLDRYGVRPKSIKVAKNKVQRGYKKEDVARAVKML